MWITGVKVGEFYKKTLVILLVMGLVMISVEVIYIVVISVRVYGTSSVVALGVYGWIMLGVRMTLMLLVYLVGNVMIELN